ncbi:hypothetical protein ACFQ3S_12230 [Mucilaginibacter terrae]|uniref:hypothetical protein n=1 Tax=Mucilaginibacter terrae TaxID=1955052 RepID=UPI003643C99E
MMIFKYSLAYIIICSFIISCNANKADSAYMKDEDYKEYSRTYSPGKTKLLIDYASHKGPFDYHVSGTAIINTKDTAGNLAHYTLPRVLTHLKWTGENSVTAMYDVIPSIRKGRKVTVKDTIINGVYVKALANDFIEQGDSLKLNYRETSPDRKHELVVYRYGKGKKAGFMHLSIIPAKGAIPKYGNYFIANPQADYIYYARWSRTNKLIFFTDNIGKDLIYYGLVKNRPAMEYQLVADDDRYKGKIRWVGW